MKIVRFPIAFIAGLVFAAPVGAQPVADHLKCYKVKDPQAPATYTADLGGLVADAGCRIKVPALMACVPATKANVTPTPPGGGGTGTPNSFFCYKAKCPKATIPPITGQDQFGSRTVTPSAAKLLCAPVASPTTTTSTTTTTSLPLCGPGGQPCGSCGNGVCLVDCKTLLPVCTGSPGSGVFCGADSDCASGELCIRVSIGSCACRPACP